MNNMLTEDKIVLDGGKVVISYEWGLASSQGAWFEMYPSKDVSKEDVKRAMNMIKSKRDAVKIKVVRLK